jgi:hypothetical protein
MSLNSDHEATNNRVPRKFPHCRPDLANALIAFISVSSDPQADDFSERPRGTRTSVKSSNHKTSAIVQEIGARANQYDSAEQNLQ